MKSTYSIALVSIALFVSSCYSTIKVQVDALNMPAFKATYLYNIESLNKKEKSIRYLLSGDFNAKVEKLVVGLTRYIDSSGVFPDNDIKKTKKNKLNESRDIMNDISTRGMKTLGSIATYKTGTSDSSLEAYEKDYTDFLTAFNRLVQFNTYIKKVNKDLGINLQGETEELLQNVSDAIDALASTFGESILKDPMASVIAALPEQYWSKYNNDVNLSVNAGGIDQKKLGDISKYVTKEPNRYNNTFARTRMGNSDIAIRMASPGEFIVKGVRVDADEAIRNSFKVVSQGIKYLVYAAGMPVKDAGSSGNNKTMGPLLDSLTQKTSDLQAAEQRYTNATDAFLAVLADASADLNATSARGTLSVANIKANALERVKTAYTIYKTAISK